MSKLVFFEKLHLLEIQHFDCDLSKGNFVNAGKVTLKLFFKSLFINKFVEICRYVTNPVDWGIFLSHELKHELYLVTTIFHCVSLLIIAEIVIKLTNNSNCTTITTFCQYIFDYLYFLCRQNVTQTSLFFHKISLAKFINIVYTISCGDCLRPSGGIGRRTRLKIVRETMRVQVPPWAPPQKLFDFSSSFFVRILWIIFV